MTRKRERSIAQPGVRRSTRSMSTQNPSSGILQLSPIVEKSEARVSKTVGVSVAEHVPEGTDTGNKKEQHRKSVDDASTFMKLPEMVEKSTDGGPTDESGTRVQDVRSPRGGYTKNMARRTIPTVHLHPASLAENPVSPREVPVPDHMTTTQDSEKSHQEGDCEVQPVPKKKQPRPRAKRTSVKGNKISDDASQEDETTRGDGLLSNSDENPAERDVENLQPYSEKFLTADTKKRYESFQGVEVISERIANVRDFRKNNVWKLFEERNLTSFLTYACPFSKSLVREFYANVTAGVDVIGDPLYHKVYVRGSFVEFSPTIVNRFFGLANGTCLPANDFPEGTTQQELEEALTGTFLESRQGQITPSELLFESRVFYTVAKHNWLPTKRTEVIKKEMALLLFQLLRKDEVNLGVLIYNNILARASGLRPRFLLLYPCLIQQIVIRQSPEVLIMAEVTERIPRAITIEARIQQARVSRSQPTGSIRTPLMKHAKLLVKAEGLFTKGMELLSQIRAEHDKFLTDYLQCGGEHDPGTEDGRNMDKGKDKVVDDSEEEVD